MDLLKYGMENRKSSLALRRCMAEAALNAEKAKADLEEKLLAKSGIEISSAEEEKLLEKIRARIEEEKKKRG